VSAGGQNKGPGWCGLPGKGDGGEGEGKWHGLPFYRHAPGEAKWPVRAMLAHGRRQRMPR
jgi:hypothetical protein